MIQGSINQLLTMSAAAVRLSPSYEKRQEELKKQKTQEQKKDKNEEKKPDKKTSSELANISKKKKLATAAEEDRKAAQEIREKELLKTREALLTNAPVTFGRRDKIVYGNE